MKKNMPAIRDRIIPANLVSIFNPPLIAHDDAGLGAATGLRFFAVYGSWEGHIWRCATVRRVASP